MKYKYMHHLNDRRIYVLRCGLKTVHFDEILNHKRALVCALIADTPVTGNEENKA